MASFGLLIEVLIGSLNHMPDFYTAWVVISKHILDYSLDPVVAYG